jgi:hypothetical protein
MRAQGFPLEFSELSVNADNASGCAARAKIIDDDRFRLARIDLGKVRARVSAVRNSSAALCFEAQAARKRPARWMIFRQLPHRPRSFMKVAISRIRT